MPPGTTRSQFIDYLHAHLARRSFIHAAWLEGADADGRADAYSDFDLWLDVDTPNVELGFDAVRTLLGEFGPLDVEYAVAHPHPQLHQRFFRSLGLPKFWFVDVVVQEHGRDVTFGPLDPYRVLFDHAGVIRSAVPEMQAPGEVLKAARALEARRWRWVLVEKEVRRGHHLEALAYYHDEVLAALVELLRLQFCPGKQGFGLKHVSVDLPAEAVRRLEDLYGQTTSREVLEGVRQASQWFAQVLHELDRRGPGKS